MDRCGSRAFIVMALAFLAALTGCVGKSSNNQGSRQVVSVSLNPIGNVSMDIGATQQFTATAKNGLGQTLTSGTHFISSNNASLTISNNGLVCAGSWDSLTTPIVCTPGVTGVSQVTAVNDGISSPITTVYVHQHIDNVAISTVGTPEFECFSQSQAFRYQATAFSNGTDITNSVGPFSWASTETTVAGIDPTATNLPNNQAQIIAKAPGISQLFASVSGVTSSPLGYTSCLISYIRLQLESGTGNSFDLAAASTKTISATAVDTLGNVVSKPPLTWNTSDPNFATVSSGTVTAKTFAGGAAISASCSPPSCNIGILPSLPVFASNGVLPNSETQAFGAIAVNVTQTKPPTPTAWAATTDCGNAFDCTSAMFNVTAGTTPTSTVVELPRTPNSMQFVPAGSRVYLGSDQGLMFVDIGSSTTVGTVSSASSPCNVIVCGKVLTISQDGNRVVVSDIPNSQVYVYDNTHSTSPPLDLLIPTAVAAAFSPDGLKLFIVSASGKLFVSSTLDALGEVAISPLATDIAFSADGSFAYVAGDPGASISEYSTCSVPGAVSAKIGSGSTAGIPLRIFPLPNVQGGGPALITTDNENPGRPQNPNLNAPSLTQTLMALEPPHIELLAAHFTQNPTTDPTQFTCRPPIATGVSHISTSDLGLGNFTPIYMQVINNGTQVILLAKNVGAVLVFNVAGGTTQTVPLVNNAVPRAASASLDGDQVFVAACEEFQDNDPTKTCLSGSVHIVNPQNGGDIQQVPFTNPGTDNSMCTRQDPAAPPCLPNLIAVAP